MGGWNFMLSLNGGIVGSVGVLVVIISVLFCFVLMIFLLSVSDWCCFDLLFVFNWILLFRKEGFMDFDLFFGVDVIIYFV